MSVYYTMYFVYKKEDKYYPIGPYAKNGKLISVSSWSRSFMSDLIDRFNYIDPKNFSEELFDVLVKSDSGDYGYKTMEEFIEAESNMVFGQTNYMVCPVKEIQQLGVNNGIVQGYLDRDLVNRLERSKSTDDYVEVSKYDFVTPVVYASMDKEEQKNYVYYAMQLTDTKSYQASTLAMIWSALEYDLRYGYNLEKKGTKLTDCYVLCSID